MTHPATADVIRRFNDAFVQRGPNVLVDLVADDCVMESADPAPNGARYEGYDACPRFWQELIVDPNGSFEPEDVVVLSRPRHDPLALPVRRGRRALGAGRHPHARPRREDRRGARPREGRPSTVRPRGMPWSSLLRKHSMNPQHGPCHDP